MTYPAAFQSWFQTGSRRRCGLRQWNKRWSMTLLQLPLQVEVDDLDAVNETAIRLRGCHHVGCAAQCRRPGPWHIRPAPGSRACTARVHRRLTTRQFTVSIADEATVDSATAAALAARWGDSSPSQLSAALGINVISASAPVVTTQTRHPERHVCRP